MSHQKRIEITIDASGEIAIDAVGFSGMGCVGATEFLERALGGKSTRKCKPEFYRTHQSLNRQSLGNTPQ